MTEARVAVAARPNAAPNLQLVETPRLVEGAALVTVLACALDAWDARLLAGQADPPPAWPLVPGRFFVGVIEALGPGLSEDSAGQRLRAGTPVLVPSVVPCGTCASCRQHALGAGTCLRPFRYGVDAAAPLSGGLADAVFVPRGAIHALPVTQPPWLATLAESFAACLHAYARAQRIGGFPPGASVVILGDDATSLLAVVAALELGAGRVVVVGGPDAPFLRLARRFGAEATIDAAAEPDPDRRAAIVLETLGSAGADIVLPRIAAPEAPSLARAGGSVILMDDARASADWTGLVRREITVLGSAGPAPAAIPVALAMLYRARSRYDFAALHGRFPFTPTGIADALAALGGAAAPRALVVLRNDLAG